MLKSMPKIEKEWKEELTPEQYKVLREKGTEPPFAGKYYKTKDKGVYKCAACGNELFSSDAKFESQEPGLIGWPSFDQALPGAVKFREDKSGGLNRIEVVCAKCGSHLGHIFNAPDAKTGKHYCINSICLELLKKKK